MSNFQDFTGMQFGRLTVIDRAPNLKYGIVMWNCVCECGKHKTIKATNLKIGKTKSCGCLQQERWDNASSFFTKHGQSKSRLYQIYADMKGRCYNKNNCNYSRYGERGIAVCDEWKQNFKSFFDWAMANGYKENLTIERIDVNGNYEPSNCTWIPRGEQGINRRVTHFVIYKGEKMPITWLADKVNVSAPTIRKYEKQFNGNYDALVDYVRNSKGYISSHKTRKENTKWQKKSKQQKTRHSRPQ